MSESSKPSWVESPARLDCTALVPTVDRPGSLGACLASLAALEPRLREIVVLDQGWGEEARALAAAAGARHLRLDARGLSRARNAGIAATQGEWLFFPDDDCTVAPGFSTAVRRFATAHPEADFLCGRVQTPTGTPLAPDMGGVPAAIRTARAVLRTAVSAGLLVRRRLLEKVGLFDERFGVGGRFPSGEESDLLLRALAAGCRGFHLPDAIVLHAEPFAVRDAAAQERRAFEYGRGWGALFAKHGTRPVRAEALLLHLHYLARATGGAASALLAGRGDMARRSLASLSGRWAGFGEYRRVHGPEAAP
jgi:GT2 family glycosyltransferase